MQSKPLLPGTKLYYSYVSQPEPQFTEAVEQLILKGFHPCGGISISQLTDSTIYCQAFTRTAGTMAAKELR